MRWVNIGDRGTVRNVGESGAPGPKPRRVAQVVEVTEVVIGRSFAVNCPPATRMTRLGNAARRVTLAIMACTAALAPPVTVHADPAATVHCRAGDDPLFDAMIDSDDGSDAMLKVPDPFEPVNRITHRFNQLVDRALLNPIAHVYRLVVPGFAKSGLRNFLSNLNAPATVINDLLQREWNDAGTGVTRFALNTSVGLGGLFDPATRMGLAGHQSDFGQTLALHGVGSGPYLMLPVLGPTTTRDGVSYLVDVLFRPTTYVLGPFNRVFYTTIQGSSSGIVKREAAIDGLHALEESSVDYYAALRSAYLQNRAAQIWSRRESHRKTGPGGCETPPEAHAGRAASDTDNLPGH